MADAWRDNWMTCPARDGNDRDALTLITLEFFWIFIFLHVFGYDFAHFMLIDLTHHSVNEWNGFWRCVLRATHWAVGTSSDATLSRTEHALTNSLYIISRFLCNPQMSVEFHDKSKLDRKHVFIFQFIMILYNGSMNFIVIESYSYSSYLSF